MGIDYGARYVGIALSDEEGSIAFPYTVLENEKKLLPHVKKICKEKLVHKIILGESLDYKQKDNIIMHKIRLFRTALAKTTGLLIHFEPEFLTSQEAKRTEKDPKKANASSAAIILQSYIDKKS